MPAGEIFALVSTAALLFAGTNVDDMIVLTVLSISSRAAGRPRPWHIWAGQYAGFAVIVAVFMAGVAVWCLASSRLAAHRAVTDAVQRWGYWAVPVVFILIGCYIFYKTGLLS